MSSELPNPNLKHAAGKDTFSTDYEKLLHEAAHPDLVKDPAKAEVMAHASHDSETAARAHEGVGNYLLGVVDEIKAEGVSRPELAGDPGLILDQETGQALAREHQELAARYSGKAGEEAEQAGALYEAQSAVNVVDDAIIAETMAHNGKALYEEAASHRNTADELRAEGNLKAADMVSELAAHTLKSADRAAEAARDQHYAKLDGQVANVDTARAMADASAPGYEAAAAFKAKTRTVEDANVRRHLSNRAVAAKRDADTDAELARFESEDQ